MADPSKLASQAAPAKPAAPALPPAPEGMVNLASQAAPAKPAAPALPPAPEGMVNVFVDGVLMQVKKGSTVMAACKLAGKEIPHFCYHERLSIAGNCRMCLLEIEGMPKPVASCHWPVAEGNKIRTDSKLTIEARKGVMEMLLINHPLDCPICDQGGECDLQDEAVGYGADRSHYHEFKRAVDDKDIGGKIKTVMTRCIHCTRCIRFATEVAGVEEFGATGRGENMQVGTYVEQALQSELAGNMIDLCPVGALTSKPYAFTARPWELESTDSIDILDGLGSHIRVDSRAGEVMRVLPRECNAINEEWMTDTARFSYDALKTNRLTTPVLHRYSREGGNPVPQPLGWSEAFAVITKALQKTTPGRIAGLVGSLQAAEDAYAFKAFFDGVLKSKQYATLPADWAVADPALLRGYTPLAQMEQADAVLILGADPRFEAPLLNLRLRRLATKKKVPVALLGTPCDLTYPCESLGESPDLLASTAGRPFFDRLAAAERPLIVLGSAVARHPAAEAVMAAAWKLGQRKNWNGYNFLTPTGGTLAPLLLGLGNSPHATSQILEKTIKNTMDVLFVHGDRDDLSPEIFRNFNGLSVYLGTHVTPLARACSVALPTAAWTEKSGQYINIEAKVQVAPKAVIPPHQAKEDWKIYRALSEILKKTLPFDTLNQLRNQLPPLAAAPKIAKSGPKGRLPAQPFAPHMTEFYLSNSYLRESPTMHRLQAEQGTAHPAPAPTPPQGMGPQKPRISGQKPDLKNHRNAA
jgi:NADH-quinone oxidoreductase subunit G